jgi:hypothetical protein
MGENEMKDEGGKTKNNGEPQTEPAVRRDRRTIVLRIVLFVMFVAMAFVVFHRVESDQRKIKDAMQIGELPEGIPNLIPFPKSIVTIDPAKNKVEDYTFTVQGGEDPTAMHQGKMYTVEGSSDRTPTEIRDFYNKLLLDKGYRQRINISLPTGHRLDLENDKNIVSIEVERKSDEKQTRVKIVLYD